MKQEIVHFKKFWKDKDVQIEIWDELTWGIEEAEKTHSYRYPCFSLWNSFNVNSDGKVSACCIDWTEQLLVGDFNTHSIAQIWQDKPLQQIRQKHMENMEKDLPLCNKCNYWFWQPMLNHYKN